MLDTNIVISMLLFPSEHFRQIMKHITENHRLVLSSFVLDEIMEVTNRKFPAKKTRWISCFQSYLTKLCIRLGK